MRFAAIAVVAALAALTGCGPGPVHGMVRYTVRLEASRQAGPLRAESAPGASHGWPAFEQAFVRGCGGHQPYAIELERAAVTLRPAVPLAAIFAGELEVQLDPPRAGDSYTLGRVVAGHAAAARLRDGWVGDMHVGEDHPVSVRGALAPTAGAHLPVDLVVTLWLAGTCIDPDDVAPASMRGDEPEPD